MSKGVPFRAVLALCVFWAVGLLFFFCASVSVASADVWGCGVVGLLFLCAGFAIYFKEARHA